MLTERQIFEIRDHLETAQNPLFFYDNDVDGLVSFLLLRRFINRGKGVAIKSFPKLNLSQYRRVDELKPDYIFILDKPEVSEDFLEKVKQDNLPIVWIDHHPVEYPKTKGIHYYNPFFNDKSGEPVSFLCQKIANRKEDLWLSVVGCLSDCFMPSFYSEFAIEYPELSLKNPKSAFDLIYNSEIGKIARILDFSLKDRTTNVVNMMKFMINVKGPLDIFEENSKTHQILKRYDEINSKYQKLMEKARKKAVKNEKLLYFQYSGDMSLSSNISNQLIYEFPKKVIAVVFVNGEIANISLRSSDGVRKITLDLVKEIESAEGGGHEFATGAKMNIDDLPIFKKKIKEYTK